ncbi:MAG: membrane dipeptidase [Tissierellia bacterium]|nr:membrane dipeptidase [Tissierellia bacterium]
MKVFNGHSDIFLKVHEDRLLGRGDSLEEFREDFKEGEVDAAVLVLYTDEHAEDPRDYLREMGKTVARSLGENAHWITHVKSREDLSAEGPKILVGMEGMRGLSGAEELYQWKEELHLAHGSLTWNEKNIFAAGAAVPDREGGLTPEGRRALATMEELGIVVDVSHLNDRSTGEVLRSVHGPVIASHSNPRALREVARNLPDDLLKAVADTGGVVGLNSIGSFLGESEGERSLEGFFRHLDYTVNLLGVDHVGLGFDFTAFLEEYRGILPGEKGFPSAVDLYRESQIPRLLEGMRAMGFYEGEMEKIAHGNFYRLFSSVLR